MRLKQCKISLHLQYILISPEAHTVFKAKHLKDMKWKCVKALQINVLGPKSKNHDKKEIHS